MTGRQSFDDALDAALRSLQAGEPLDRVLAAHPAHAATLRPMLETALDVRASAGYEPPSARLFEHVAIVRAAAQRAQMDARAAGMRTVTPHAPRWWQRRLTFASMSLPVGIIALMALGAGGAAAASVAATSPGLTSQVAGAMRPGWVNDLVPGHEDPPAGAQRPENTPAGADTPGGAQGPTAVELAGVVEDAHGNVFTLTDGSESWHVQIDSHTSVDGDIADGASVTVSGDVTAERNVHADDVSVTVPASTPTETATPPGQDKTPRPEKTPAPPEKTPPANEPTKGPPADHTPPGAARTPSNGNGNPEPENNNGNQNQ